MLRAWWRRFAGGLIEAEVVVYPHFLMKVLGQKFRMSVHAHLKGFMSIRLESTNRHELFVGRCHGALQDERGARPLAQHHSLFGRIWLRGYRSLNVTLPRKACKDAGDGWRRIGQKVQLKTNC